MFFSETFMHCIVDYMCFIFVNPFLMFCFLSSCVLFCVNNFTISPFNVLLIPFLPLILFGDYCLCFYVRLNFNFSFICSSFFFFFFFFSLYYKCVDIGSDDVNIIFYIFFFFNHFK